MCVIFFPPEMRLAEFDTLTFPIEPSILWPQQGGIKARHLLKYWAAIAAFWFGIIAHSWLPLGDITLTFLPPPLGKPFLFQPPSFQGRCPWKICISVRVPVATFWWRWNGKGAGGGMLPAMWSEGRVGSRVATADAPGTSFYTEGFYNRAGTYTPNTSTAGDAPTEIQALRETHWDWGRVTHPRKLYI